MITTKFECACPNGPMSTMRYADRPGEGDKRIFFAECTGCLARWEKAPGVLGTTGPWTRVQAPQQNPDGTPYEGPKTESAEPIRAEGQSVEEFEAANPSAVQPEAVEAPAKEESFQDKMFGAVTDKLMAKGGDTAKIVSQITGKPMPDKPAEEVKAEDPVVVAPAQTETKESKPAATPTANPLESCDNEDDPWGDLVWQEVERYRDALPVVASAGDAAYRLRVACARYWDWAKDEDEEICPLRLLAGVAAEAQRIAEDLGWTEAEAEEDEGGDSAEPS